MTKFTIFFILSITYANIFCSYENSTYKSEILNQASFNNSQLIFSTSEDDSTKINVEVNSDLASAFSQSPNIKLKSHDIAKFELMKERLVSILEKAIVTKNSAELDNFKTILEEVELPDELQFQLICSALEKADSKCSQSKEILKKIGVNALGVGTGVLAFIGCALIYKLAER